MNNKLIYLPISLLVIASVIIISLEMPHYNLMSGFMNLGVLSMIIALLITLGLYFKYKGKMDFDNLYVLLGSSVLFSFVISIALSSFFNRKYATQSCDFASYKVVEYKGRFSSGYGNIKKGKVKANQWIMVILKDNKRMKYVLDHDIRSKISVTNEIELEFCKGIVNTEYLKME